MIHSVTYIVHTQHTFCGSEQLECYVKIKNAWRFNFMPCNFIFIFTILMVWLQQFCIISKD